MWHGEKRIKVSNNNHRFPPYTTLLFFQVLLSQEKTQKYGNYYYHHCVEANSQQLAGSYKPPRLLVVFWCPRQKDVYDGGVGSRVSGQAIMLCQSLCVMMMA